MSGATNCPETPRQKMIGMMYLVLTAMLALNVSTDVLNGFTLVDRSLHSSIDGTMSRNAKLYSYFKAARDENPEKADQWYQECLRLRENADSLYWYIQHFKEAIVALADGQEAVDLRRASQDPEIMSVAPDGSEYADITRQIIGNSNLDVTAQYAIVEGNGKILREEMKRYRDYIIYLVDPNGEGMMADQFRRMFATEKGWNSHDQDSCDWEIAMFEGMPVGASNVLLTKIQADIRNSESQMINFLMQKIDAGDLRVNKMNAYVIPKSEYVIRGAKYSARIVLAAIDSTQTPDFYVNGAKCKNGVYELITTGTGVQTYKGRIEYKGPDGNKVSLPFESSYTVGEPMATISNTDLNILYRSFDNNLSISVPGMSVDKLDVEVTGATLKNQGKGKWIVKPAETSKEVTVKVYAKVEGTNQLMGSQKYRVKALPKPSVYFQVGDVGYQDYISRNALLNKNGYLLTSYGPDGLLDLPWTVVSFKVNINGSLSEVKGNKFGSNEIAKIEKLKKGAMVGLVDISAKGPDGKITKLSNILLTMN